MSPELEKHLLDIGDELAAQRQLLRVLLALADRPSIEGNLRLYRIKLQEVRGRGDENPILERCVAILEEGLGMPRQAPSDTVGPRQSASDTRIGRL